MSTPFFNLDNVRMDRFVRLDPDNGQLVAPLKKGTQSWQSLPLRKRKGLAKVKTYALGAVTLESTAAYAVFKLGSVEGLSEPLARARRHALLLHVADGVCGRCRLRQDRAPADGLQPAPRLHPTGL
jgi:hypothetical protein